MNFISVLGIFEMIIKLDQVEKGSNQAITIAKLGG